VEQVEQDDDGDRDPDDPEKTALAHATLLLATAA
jgi:hypothetical protein